MLTKKKPLLLPVGVVSHTMLEMGFSQRLESAVPTSALSSLTGSDSKESGTDSTASKLRESEDDSINASVDDEEVTSADPEGF